VTAKRYRYTGARWLTAIALRDAVLLAALGMSLVLRTHGTLALLLGVAIPVVLAWGLLTLHYPSAVELDDEGITFRAYGRAHAFPWRAVERVRVRRFLVKDRVLVRLSPAPAWRGRYWILDSLDGFDELVRALERRANP
jgi:hypothetical protein